MMNKNIFPDVPDVVHNAVLDALDSLEYHGMQDDNIISMRSSGQNRRRRRAHLPKVAAACITCFLVSGITVSAVGAVNAYRQRMEAMDLETMEEYYQIADAGEATELNRPYTEDESKRYDELNRKYESGSILPLSEVTYIQSAEEYSGTGVALDTTCRTLYLPEDALTDEELLQIIDLHHKEAYSINHIATERLTERLKNGSSWYERMEQMSDDMVTEVYLAMFGNKLDVGGGSNRPMSEAENSRYEELKQRYEEEGLFAVSDITIITTPEEYTGNGIALCSEDSTYYFPETELTDEELLQYIDFEHKANYCLDRIRYDIDLGLRTGYPEW